MPHEPVHRRKIRIFLSHASADKKTIVDQLYNWLNDIANITVWYDRERLSGGVSFVSELAQAIPLCRSMLIVISQASVKSKWVEEEYSLALNHQAQYRDFNIIPLLLDDCDVPGFLQNKNYIRLENNSLSLETCDQLLRALYPGSIFLDPDKSQDIYISRTWREGKEAELADRVCQTFADARFRLVGDSKDHPTFRDDRQRVENIVASCGGMLAVLPYRSESAASGYTSPYMLREIDYARKHHVPYIIVAEAGVAVADEQRQEAMLCLEITPETADPTAGGLAAAVAVMRERWKASSSPHHVFFGTHFDSPTRNQLVRKTIQRITAMPCIMGQDIRIAETSLQQAIINQIRAASLVIGDISEENINTLIEMGAARGASTDYYLIARGPSRKPPFMFRDREVSWYNDDVELLGLVHNLVYPFRRRILNYELENQR